MPGASNSGGGSVSYIEPTEEENMTKRKYPPTADRIEIFRTAWREIASESTFAGMSLAQFEARVAPVKEVASKLEALATQRAAAQTEQLQIENDAKLALSLVINAVRGDPAHGEDSRLYRALGFVPKSERRSGLTRRGPAPPAAGEAA